MIYFLKIWFEVTLNKIKGLGKSITLIFVEGDMEQFIIIQEAWDKIQILDP